MDRTDKIVASLLVTTIIGSVAYYFLVHKKKTEVLAIVPDTNVLAIVPDTKVLIKQLPDKPNWIKIPLQQTTMLGSNLDLDEGEVEKGRGRYVKK